MALPKTYSAFFKELGANNSTTWFNANKKRYEQEVKKPFTDLVEEVIALMEKADSGLQATAKDCIFRINRDIRFSNDKRPYKEFMEAIVSKGGRKDHSTPGIYFQVGPGTISIAGGCYAPEKEDLLKMRKAIARDPKAVNKILSAKKFKDLYGDLAGEKYKILPPEFKAAAEIAPVMLNKSFHYEKNYKGETYVTRSDLAKFIVDHFKAAEGWNEFIRQAIKK